MAIRNVQLRKMMKQAGGKLDKVLPKNIKPETLKKWAKRLEK